MTLWWIAIALAVVVTVVVGVLLAAIIRTASDIRGGVAEIWARGQRVANNTIHIPSLYKTNEVVVAIEGRAAGILDAATAIAAHAAECPGCPQCIVGRAKP